MKVIFLRSVEGTAQAGEVKVVKNGFARNFLLPRGLAAPAVEPYLQRAEAGARREAKEQEALDRDATTIAEKLDGSRITMSARVGEQGKLYGSVTSVHIAAEVAKLLGDDEFDHRKVLLPEALKEIGLQPVRVRLTRNIEAAIEVEVLAEGEDGEILEEQPEVGGEASAAAEGDTALEEPVAGLEEASEEQDTAEEPAPSPEPGPEAEPTSDAGDGDAEDDKSE